MASKLFQYVLSSKASQTISLLVGADLVGLDDSGRLWFKMDEDDFSADPTDVEVLRIEPIEQEVPADLEATHLSLGFAAGAFWFLEIGTWTPRLDGNAPSGPGGIRP